MAIKREIRRTAMQDPFGGDPALEALTKDYFEKRKHERMRKGLARAGQFPMALMGIPAAQREALAPIKPVRVSYEDAATFNRGIHDRLKDLEQYLSSPGASAQKANEKLADIYKEVLSEASSNARTNATNVTRVALGRAGIEADLDEAIEARLEGEEVGFQGPSEKQIADAMVALDKALLDPTEPEIKVEQILTKFGASHPDYLEDLTDTIRGKAVHLETGSAIDVDNLLAKAKANVAQVDSIRNNPEAKKAWGTVKELNSFVEAVAEADAARFSEFMARNQSSQRRVIEHLRAGGTAVGPEAEKLFEVLEMLDNKYGGLQNPEDILKVENATRPKTQAMYNKVAESLVTPSAPTAFEESERALVGSPGFKEFMQKHGLTKNQAVKLLVRQARRGGSVAPVAGGAGAPPKVVDVAAEAVDEARPVEASPKTSPGAALAAPAGGERPKKPAPQEGLDRLEAQGETSWFDEQGGELGEFGLPPQSEMALPPQSETGDLGDQQVTGAEALRSNMAIIRDAQAQGRQSPSAKHGGLWGYTSVQRTAHRDLMNEFKSMQEAKQAAGVAAARAKEAKRIADLVDKESEAPSLFDIEDLL